MRELIRDMIEIARRVDVAHGSARSGEPVPLTRIPPAARANGDASLGAQAVRLARLAAVAHMDQAAKLRATVAHAEATQPATAPSNLEVSP